VTDTTPLLQIENLHASAGGTEILKGVDLTVDRGEIHALMGPNGSGKSTLANVLMGNPVFRVTEGTVTYKGEDITDAMPTDRGARPACSWRSSTRRRSPESR
jgi:Fe-S cluster assembly ATP-binding protein